MDIPTERDREHDLIKTISAGKTFTYFEIGQQHCSGWDMVFRGRPSNGCSTCRQRKIKCDEVLPKCTQCVKAGWECPGYRCQLDLLFRDESLAVMRKATRSAPDQSLKSKPDSKSRPLRNDMRKINVLQSLSGNPSKLGVGVLDPFQTFCVEIQPEMEKFVHSFLSSENSLLALGSSTPMKDVWLPKIMSDPLVFHAMLYHSAGKIASRLNMKSYNDVYRYQYKVIRLLNERLQDPSKAVTEETLITVLGLTVQAITRNEEELAHMHMCGLRLMVAQGGGLDQIAIPLVLREAIIWSDMRYAFTFNTTPQLYLSPSMPHFNSLPLVLYHSPPPSLSSLGVGFRSLPVFGPWQVFHSVAHELRCHAIIVDIAHKHGRRHYESTWLVEKLLFVEHQLLNMSVSALPPILTGLKDLSAMWESCRLAAMVFVNAILRVESLVERDVLDTLMSGSLKSVLEAGGIWEGYEELLIWNQFMAYIAASGDPSLQDWHVAQFVGTIDGLGVEARSKQSLKILLARFLWADSLCGPMFEELCSVCNLT